MATPRVTIPELPAQTALVGTDLLVVQSGTETKKMTISTLTAPSSGALATHLANPTDAHDASAVSAIPNTAPMTGTNVQLQLGQAASGLAAAATGTSGVQANLDAHLADASDAHDAAAISVNAIPGRPGITVQAVLADLADDPQVPGVFTSGANGLAPASGGGIDNYLRADGTWNAPAGGGTEGIPSGGTIGQVLAKDTNTDFDVSWQDVATEGWGGQILDGTDPPDPALGLVGDYYEDTTNGVLYGPKSASGWGTQQIPSTASTPNSDGTNDEQGTRWRFARAGRIVGIRYRRMATSAGTLTLKAWRDSTSSKVAEIADVQSTAAQFTVTFPTPVPVTGGETLTFTTATTGNNPYRAVGGQVVTNTVDVTYVEYRSNATLDAYPSTVGTANSYVEPIFEPNEAWPVTVRTVAVAQSLAGGITVGDGDKGEISVTAGVWTIDSGAVTNAKLANVTGPIIHGRVTGTGAVLDLTPAEVRAVACRTSVTAYSGTAVTAVLGDANMYLRFTGTNPTFTVPPNSSVAFVLGTQIDGIGVSTAMTLIQGSGVTINKARTLVTVGAKSGWTAIKVATDEWDLHGDFV